MNITSVRIYPGDGKYVIAYASVRFDRDLMIDHIRVVELQGKPSISMPSLKTRSGKHSEVAYPLNDTARMEIKEVILYEIKKGNWSNYKREALVSE